VRDSVFGATIITIVVFSPVFALTGVEGSILFNGIIWRQLSLLATALTVTPAFVCDFTAFRSLARKRALGGEIFKQLYHPC